MIDSELYVQKMAAAWQTVYTRLMTGKEGYKNT